MIVCCRLPLLCLACIVMSLAWPALGHADVSVNLPLDDPAYPLLEKIVRSNLTFTNALTLKPITRRYAAHLIAEAIDQRRIELDTANRQDPFIDQALEELARRFKAELQQIGFLTQVRPPQSIVLAPLTELTFEMAFAHNPFVHRDSSGTTPNLQGVFTRNEGYVYGDDFSLRTRAISWATFWDHAAIYLEPETLIRTNPIIGRRFDANLHKGYLKLSAANLELAFGRDALAWGPASQGDLVISNNAPPFELVKISNPRPFRLPGPFAELGEWQMAYFVARLEGSRTISHPLLSGLRATFQPAPFLQFGFTNAFLAFGEGGVELDPLAFARRVFVPELDTGSRTINSVVAYNAVLTLPFVRHLGFLHGAQVYWQRGNDNVRDVSGLLGGGNILGAVLDGGRWDLRFEFAETRDGQAVWYSHPTYQSGFAFEQFFIGHPIGGAAQSFFGRATYYLTPTAWIAADGRHEQYGFDVQPVKTTQQRFGLEGSYQLAWAKRHLVLWARIEYAMLAEPATSTQRAMSIQLSGQWRF